ncbi:hypothetical protein I2485_09695 [Nesterenkonia sp. E16_7]|uniref:hypothetical protein n=1 Tax=unclassified Nesterenkonia TaxID=2629769 RepID=UPI001A9262FB|nr:MULTISPECIES: hypothetical protein [unclassified Nesterenkonia]MBO0595203.1 hypothetical protein [Nesterenkonia sp. E16_10]MBO0598916.1 hypothetical protein [Nesterenkonia sp. E16_7]
MALAVNIVIDLSTDMPMLLRWAVAIGVAMVVTVVLSRWTAARTQGASAAPGESPESLR